MMHRTGHQRIGPIPFVVFLTCLAVFFAPSASAHPDKETSVRHAAAGPWGHLVYVDIVLDAPEEAFQPATLVPQPVRWQFSAKTWPEAAGAMQQAGISESVIEKLAGQPRTNMPDGFSVIPSEDLLLTLDPTNRARLYAALAASPANTLQHEPYRFRSPDGSDWFDELQPQPELYGLLERLTYRRGELELFSDTDLALSRAPTPVLRKEILQALCRSPTLLARLEILPKDDLEALATYWGRGGRVDDVLPLLEAIQHHGQDWKLSLLTLLPPFARTRLYTFDTEPGAGFRDCHWTSLNFAQREEDDRFMDPATVKRVLLQDYQRVPKADQLGDILLFRDKQQRVVHSCVYIADQIVFTKNGGEAAQAWVLMRLDDVLSYYTINGPLDVIPMRQRN